MANYYIDTCIRTNPGDFRGHRLKGWKWCIFFWFMVILPYVLTKDVANTVAIYPEGDIYVRYGDSLKLYCKVTGGNSTSQDLTFTFGGMPFSKNEIIIVNKTTIELFIEKPKQHGRQTYYCKNMNFNTNALASVVVASPPADVKDFKCISRNFDVMNCSWTTPDLIIETNYTLNYVRRGTETSPSLVASPVEGTLTRYCIWRTNSTPRYSQLDETFHFILRAYNKIGNNKQSFIIDHYSVVKPDPPMKFRNMSVSPHSVMLHWSIPDNIYDFLKGGIEHKIEYQIAKIDNTSYFRSVNTTGLPIANKTYKFNLTGLPYAHMQYGIRVYIKPIRAKNEFWSDFSTLVYYTASEKPRRPPDMAAGGFYQSPYDKYRVIRVYWKQLEEYEEAGANFSYKVLVRPSSKPEPYFLDKGLGFLEIKEATKEAMEISVWSYNEKGSSTSSSQLYIAPESETRSLKLTSFTKLAYQNGTYELSWLGIDNVDNYTLFWCKHNITCNGHIDFTVLEPNKTKHVINLPDYTYQFAISANKGESSGGMTWATCDISKDEIAMYRFPVAFTDHGAAGKTSVELMWSMNCILKKGIILGYNISYCPVIETSDLCDKNGKNHTKYIDDPDKMDTTIENLEPYTTYKFTMALNTIYGLKPSENTVARITTVEDAPTSPRNVSISDVRNDSLVISWDQPEHLNTHISKIKYVIYNFNKKFWEVRYEDKFSNHLRINVTLDNLQGFTNYSFTVQACNEGIDACSEPTLPLTLRNCIGAPGKLKTLSYEDSSDVLTWEPPEIWGGTIDEYQIKIVKDRTLYEIVNTTNRSYPVTQCDGNVEVKKYYVRAVNYDVDSHYGAATDSDRVTLPTRPPGDDIKLAYPGEWSDEYPVLCHSKNNLFLFFIVMGVLAIIGAGYGVLKAYKKLRIMRDIKPEFPEGLFTDKDNKYPFSALYPPNKDEKPSSDETLLLPNSKTSVSTPDLKQKENDNCASSDLTDSTALSDVSQGPIDRQNSTSDDDSHSSLHLEVEPNRIDDNNALQEQTSNSDSESSQETSPYFSDNAFKKNKITGYVQPVVNPLTGFVPPETSAYNNPSLPSLSQPVGSSYVMAGLPTYPGGTSDSTAISQPPPSSGYVRPDDGRSISPMNFPKLGPSPTKIFGPESLPTMPTLPPPTKNGADSSYIQLQSLDSLPSQKPTIRNSVPLKPTASSGYVSPGDAVINKHLKNIMSGGQLAEEPAILDPAMSLDAYCRFSWSTDPANDNLHSLLSNPTLNPSNN